MYDNSVCLRLHIFPLVQYIYMFSRVQQRLHILPLVQYKLHVSSRLANLHVFPRLSQITAVLVFPLCENVTSLPALDTDYMFLTSTVTTTLAIVTDMFSSVWHLVHVFPRLAPVTFCRMFSSVWHRSPVFPRLDPVVFSGVWHWVHVFPRLKEIFFRAQQPKQFDGLFDFLK